MTLKEAVYEAEQNKSAIGHFNFCTIEGLHAIVHAARFINVPVIVGNSEGERDFVGVKETAALVKAVREEYDIPIFLNADHTYSLEKIKQAALAGFDSVIFDGAKLSVEDNIERTKEAVIAAKRIKPDILVEGELGYIGTSSELLDTLPEGVAATSANYTTPEEAERFVKETGIDMFAPAVGNVHGMLRVGHDPKLDIERIQKIKERVHIPLVLHGGSGNTDDDFRNAIKAGISIVHINTELRVAFRDALKSALSQMPDEVAPYKLLKEPKKAMEEVVRKKLALFSHP